MRVIYLAAPVSGDVPGNLAKAKRWVRYLEEEHSDVAVVAPWITGCSVWDESNPEHREAGMRRDLAVLERCDELWAVGPRVSAGMEREMKHARLMGIPVHRILEMDDGR